jgi:hypothetical protein
VRARIITHEKNLLAIRISGLLNCREDKHSLKLAEALRARPIIIAAQAEIDRQIADADDWRTIGDARARDKEWGRQQTLIASKRALVIGVEYFSGCPAVPAPLRVIFGETILPDGRRFAVWHGSLSEIDAEIARRTPIVDARKAECARLHAVAAELLGKS